MTARDLLRARCAVCDKPIVVHSPSAAMPRHQQRGGEWCSGAGQPPAGHVTGSQLQAAPARPAPTKVPRGTAILRRSPSTWPEGPVRSNGDLVRVLGLARPAAGRRPSQDEYEIRNALLAQIDLMSGPQFEILVAAMLRRDRFWSDVEVVGGRGDGGIDIVARHAGQGTLLVQCKRQSTTVAPAVVRQLLGSMHEYQAVRATPKAAVGPEVRGMVATSANFSASAIASARAAGVTLVGRTQLSTWLSGRQPLIVRSRHS